MESDRPCHAALSNTAAHRPLLLARPHLGAEVIEADAELKALPVS